MDRTNGHLIIVVSASADDTALFTAALRLEKYSVKVLPSDAALEHDERAPEAAAVIVDGGPRCDPMRVLKCVQERRYRAAVFVICDRSQVDLAIEVLRAGATDVLVRPITPDDMIGSLTATMSRAVDVRWQATAAGTPTAVVIRGFDALTPREREVLQLITNGRSNKQAGRELGISPRTIEVHRARVMEKLGARNTADLMRIVLVGY